MKRVIRLSGYWVIGFIVVFLSSYAFAQEKPVELKGVIAKIPAARILDWACGDCAGGIPTITPTVNGNPGWQEQALSQGNVVCCPDDGNAGTHNYVVVSLNRPATNLATLQEGACLTINEADGSSADSVSQNGGEILFDLALLESGSSFSLETPTATTGVSGTTFNVYVVDVNFDGDGDPTTVANGDYTITQVLEVSPGKTLAVDDKYPDVALGDLSNYPMYSAGQLQTIKGSPNVYSPGTVTNYTPSFSNPGKQLGQCKQEAGEIATESRGEKKGFME